MFHHTLALCVSGVMLAVAAGCGGGDGDTSTAEGTVDAFLEAAASGDAETACGLVESGAEVPFYTAMGFEPTGECEDEVTANAEDEGLANLEWTLTTDGDTVTAEFVEPPGGENLLDFTLEQSGEEWTITEVGSSF